MVTVSKIIGNFYKTFMLFNPVSGKDPVSMTSAEERVLEMFHKPHFLGRFKERKPTN